MESATASLPPPTETPLPTVTVPPSPTSSPTVTPIPVSAICSPLTLHAISDLPAMVSWKFDPSEGVRHYGLDLAHWQWGEETSSLYDPVQAVMDGRVAGIVLDRPPSGYLIIIETPWEQLPTELIEALQLLPGESIYHQYAHLADPPELAIGQALGCGQALDRVGLTGWTVAAHLHLETRRGPAGFTFQSMAYYSADATPEEMAVYETWFSSGAYQAFDPMTLFFTEGQP